MKLYLLITSGWLFLMIVMITLMLTASTEISLKQHLIPTTNDNISNTKNQ